MYPAKSPIEPPVNVDVGWPSDSKPDLMTDPPSERAPSTCRDSFSSLKDQTSFGNTPAAPTPASAPTPAESQTSYKEENCPPSDTTAFQRIDRMAPHQLDGALSGWGQV
jgi:hypothetical protein